MVTETKVTDELGTALTQTRSFDSVTGRFLGSSGAVTSLVSRRKTLTRTWNRTAGFAEKKRTGNLPVNAYTYNREIVTRHAGSSFIETVSSGTRVTQTITGLISTYQSSIPTIPSPSVAQKTAAYNRCVTKLLNKAKDQKVNFAQFVAEREQAFNLLTTTAVRLSKLYTSLRRGDIRGAADAMGTTINRAKRKTYKRNWKTDKAAAASDAWLELQYGWKPLLSDIYGSIDMISQKGTDAMEKTVSTREAVTVNTMTSQTTTGPSTLVTTGYHRYTVKLTVTYRLPAVDLNAHLATQLGLSNPALLAWELLPYSFVVDWFLPVGASLSSLDATLGLVFKHGAYTVVNESSGQEVYTTDLTFGSGVTRRFLRQSRGSKNTLSIVRTALGSFPSATLPTFKNPLSRDHCLNAIALLNGVFRRRN